MKKTEKTRIGIISAGNVTRVVIASPPWLQARHVKDCAERGIPILCEKPLATSLEDCRAIIDAGKQHNVYLMMGHCKRFDPGHQKVRKSSWTKPWEGFSR